MINVAQLKGLLSETRRQLAEERCYLSQSVCSGYMITPGLLSRDLNINPLRLILYPHQFDLRLYTQLQIRIIERFNERNASSIINATIGIPNEKARVKMKH
jgi:hypothetical protein